MSGDAIIKPTGLALMREKFPAHQISQLPKGGRMLDFVGHAALTDRLLDADSAWTWEPLSMADSGLPVMDDLGGMWIRLTVCGVTRLGYGHAGSKTGGDAIKEVIGDALRNAAMRFGAALDLWHKGDLHADDDAAAAKPPGRTATKPATATEGDTTPKARAMRLMVGVSSGDAAGAAAAIASWDQALIEEVWKHLDDKSVTAINANWPKD